VTAFLWALSLAFETFFHDLFKNFLSNMGTL
jgi:hypothetical protein